MALVVGTKLKDKHRDAWTAALTSALNPGEQLVALVRTNLTRPLCDGVAVTNARIAGFLASNVEAKGCRVEVFADDLVEVGVSSRRGGDHVVAQRRDGTEVDFGWVRDQDIEIVLEAGRRLLLTGTPPQVRAAIERRSAEEAADEDRWSQVRVVGRALSDKAWRTIREHAAPGEAPWFVIGQGSHGVFAAFADRCMIIKVGALTSLMADSLGGGRITTFPYSDITGIEYNAGMVNGVLEILTPSYQGTANKDYWRGLGTTNQDANNPRALSNTLPLVKSDYKQALPLLNELRSKIADAKRPRMVVQQAPAQPMPVAGDLVSELSRLGNLHQQGLLTDDEFRAAKQAVIARHG